MDPVTAMAIAEGGYNIYRGIRAQQGLSEIAGQRQARYMDAASPIQQNIAMARRQYNQGLSPLAEARAREAFGSSQAKTYRQATEFSGGQMSSALGRMGALQNYRFGSDIAMQDQMARERGQQMLMGQNLQLSGLQQRDVAQDISDRQRTLQNYGLARQQAIQGVFSAASGAVMADMNRNEAEKDRELMRELYGRGGTPRSNNGGTPSPINLVGEPGSFRFSSPIGPKEGPPNLMNLPPSMGGTNLKAGFMPQPSTPPNLMNLPPSMGGTSLNAGFMPQPSTPPNLMNLPPSMGGTSLNAGFMPQPSTPPNLMNLPRSMGGTSNRFSTPASTIQVPSNFSTPLTNRDMSGDVFYQSLNSPNALTFSNPFGMNRGFMYSYDAVPGPNGEITYRPR